MKTLRDKLKDNPVPKFRTINPSKEHGNEDYNSYFLDRYEKYADLRKAYGQLRKNPADINAKEDAGDYIWGDPEFYKGLKDAVVLTDAKNFSSMAEEAMARYAQKNENTFYDKLKEEDYKKLIMNVPLYKKLDDSNHDAFVDILNEAKKIHGSGENLETMAKYLVDKAEKNQDLELEWFKIAIRSNQNNPQYIQRLFSLYLNESNRLVSDAMEKVDAEKVFKDSLQEAKDALDDETIDKVKWDIWDTSIKPLYLGLANRIYEIEDKESEEDKPQEKIDKDERKAKRREKGMFK